MKFSALFGRSNAGVRMLITISPRMFVVLCLVFYLLGANGKVPASEEPDCHQLWLMCDGMRFLADILLVMRILHI